MRIGFDAKRYFNNNTGLGNYSRELVRSYHAHYPEDELILFHPSKSLQPVAEEIQQIHRGDSSLMPGWWWRTWQIPREAERQKLDVYHGLSNELPRGSSRIPMAVTIHDVLWKRFPSHYSAIDRTIYQQKALHAVKQAEVIIAISEQTRRDIEEFLNPVNKRIEVVYQSVPEKQFPRKEPAIPQPYLLYVSSFQERKNHLFLLKAYDASGIKMPLVLAGRPGETLSTCRNFIREKQLEKQVMLMTDTDDAALDNLYRHAAAFVYASLNEGFGIPLIEALRHRLPLIVPDEAVYREVSAEAAWYYPAGNSGELVHLLKEAEQQRLQIAPNLIETQLKRFEPAETAAQLHRIYRSLL